MAEDSDRDSRTEEPTEKRLFEATEKGNVPFSREAVTFGSMLALAIALLYAAGGVAADITAVLRDLLGHAGDIHLSDREASATFLASLGRDAAGSVLSVLAILAGGGIIASLVQNVPSLAAERIKPKTSRISPAAGWRRIFGKAGLVEFGKSVQKLVVVITVTCVTLRRHIVEVQMSLQEDPASLPETVLRLVTDVVVTLCVFALLLAAADLVWSRFKWRRDLRMTRQQVKDEMKQAEGDPHIKSRIRAIARQMSSRRMLDKIPTATMVIVNPTHYAIALRYAREQAGAPVVVAKGVDFMALRIREIATGHDIPLIENKPLARALFETAPLDSQIPPEFYRAVAEIIQFLSHRRRPPVPVSRH